MRNQELKENIEKIYQEMVNLLVSKGADYSGEVDTFKNFRLSSQLLDMPVEKVILTRLLDKISRVSNLLNSGVDPNNESLEDSFRDLLGYSTLLVLYRHKTQRKNNQTLEKKQKPSINEYIKYITNQNYVHPSLKIIKVFFNLLPNNKREITYTFEDGIVIKEIDGNFYNVYKDQVFPVSLSNNES